MLRTTHHFISIPSECPDSVQVEFHVVWDIDGKDCNISDVVIDMADPDVYTREQLHEIIMDYIDIHNIKPLGETNEASDHVD